MAYTEAEYDAKIISRFSDAEKEKFDALSPKAKKEVLQIWKNRHCAEWKKAQGVV